MQHGRLKVDKTHKSDVLFQARRLLLTRNRLLEGEAALKIDAIITDARYTALARLWSIYQAIIAAYDNPKNGSVEPNSDALTPEGTRTIPELRSLARTLRRRRNDILAFFTHPYSSNGPTEAINGRLEHLRGIALGFRNLSHYILRSLLHTGGFKHHLPSLL